MTKYQFIEEPCVVKVTSTVLKTSGYREVLAEFNPTWNILFISQKGHKLELIFGNITSPTPTVSTTTSKV